MATSLLTTKLNIPPARPQLVARPRLNERLQEGIQYNLILVSAPAGFGKTTLVSEWARQIQPQTATTWVSLDEGDNDPVRFWDYFIAALRKLQPDIGCRALETLHSPQTPPVESMLTSLINELSGAAGDIIVVLDDYHLIESKQVQDGITYLLEHLPERIHIVIAARTDPPLPLARFRGREMVLEVRTDDLRFTPDEVTKLLNELKTAEFTPKDIAALHERTEGWAAGLKMAALSMRGHEDIPGFIAAFTGSHRYVMDYLLEEVLQKQTGEVRDFLLKTSVLRRLTAPLCDAVTEGKDSRDILDILEREQLFIVPLDESRQWYRYEHLFADLLQHQCAKTHGTEQVAALHKQACQWYQDNNLPDNAIHHALAVRDWETAMRLIYARSEELRNRAEWNTVLGWLKTIPEELLREHHKLYCQYAACLSNAGEYDNAEASLCYLESAAQEDDILQADVAFLLSNIAWKHRDFARMLSLSEKSLSLLPPDYHAMRSRAVFETGFVQYIRGLFSKAEQSLTESFDEARQGGDIWLAANVLTILGNINLQLGNPDKAIDLFKRAIGIAGQTQGAAAGQAYLSQVSYERNDLEAATEYAKLATRWYEFGGRAESAVIAYFVQARICLAQGDAAGTAAATERMDRANRHPTDNPFFHAQHAAFSVIPGIRQNNMDAADKWSEKLSEYSETLEVQYHYIPARLLIARGRKEEAAALLSELYNKLMRMGAHGLIINVRVCQALAAETEEKSLEFLAEALTKGEAAGFIRTFVDEGELLKPLLKKALSNRVTPEYTGKLISIIEAEERQKSKRKKEEGTAAPYQSLLSEREIEVLKLMAEGLSNQQIAGRLIISAGTAKNHVHNILGKLEAEGRTQAVALARELELI